MICFDQGLLVFPKKGCRGKAAALEKEKSLPHKSATTPHTPQLKQILTKNLFDPLAE